MRELSPSEVLNCPMQDNDAGAATIRQYLVKLLFDVWDQQEEFNGKRPFGNSGWWGDLYIALLTNTDIGDGSELDEDGYLDHTSPEQDRCIEDGIRRAILSLGEVN